MKYYLRDKSGVFEALGTGSDGLSAGEAASRLSEHGPNRLEQAKKITLLRRFLGQLADPMIIILLAAAGISAVTSLMENHPVVESAVILAVVVLNSVLGVFQENKAEKALDALKEMTPAMCRALRDGAAVQLRAEELVPGDIVLLEAGDSVPADVRIIESASLKIEEAALTGESVPVDKTPDALAAGENGDVPLGDRKNMAYMSGIVVYGRGRAIVTQTGMKTEVGKIARAISETRDGETPLQKKLLSLSHLLTWLVLGICVFIFAFSLISEGQYEISKITELFMISVSLAVAAIPEGLVAVVTIVLSVGVTKMAKQHAIIRRLTAVETLGSAKTICSDKTGTLTLNKMTVTETYGDEALLAEAMALCSDAGLGSDGQAVGEPTESALVAFAARIGLLKPDLEKKSPRIGEAPFDSNRKMMSTVHETGGGCIQYTKGAPDELIGLCTRYIENGAVGLLTEEKRGEILERNKSFADRALRVLGAAYREHDVAPADYSAVALEKDLVFIGLAGMIDPVRPEAVEAVRLCESAGITAVMITGDHRDTATAIARELGILKEGEEALTGAELEGITDEELSRDAEKYRVYARVQPEHKVRIVRAWQSRGAVTAMTGDGVNDAPAIKAADIGVGMGITGTDVTKNVADMVLTDDNFATIVSAVREGRRIYDNIRKAIAFLLASNLSEVIAIFAATVLGFVILKPVQILWINLVTDSLPALALGMEEAEPDIMSRPPRPANEGVFSGGMGFNVAYQGVMVAILTIAAYFIGHFIESGVWEITDSPHGMTMAFLTLSMAEIFHSFNMRSQKASVFSLKTHNFYLFGGMVLSLVLTTAILFIPFLNGLFGLAEIGITEYLISILLALAVIPIVEAVKLVMRGIARKKSRG